MEQGILFCLLPEGIDKLDLNNKYGVRGRTFCV